MEANTIILIIYIAMFVLSLVTTILSVIIKHTKSEKTKNTATSILNIVDKIQGLIIEAEKHVNYSGNDKFDFVMTRMKAFLMANKIAINEDTIIDLIEKEIVLSKNVNTNANIENVSRETLNNKN